MIIESRGASEASYVAENNLLDVERDMIEVDRFGAHLESKELRQEDEIVCTRLECVDGAVCVTQVTRKMPLVNVDARTLSRVFPAAD